MRVLVAGATGQIGQHLVRAFSARGASVFALARDGLRMKPFVRELVEVRQADLREKWQLEGMCRGIDTIVSTVGVTKWTERFGAHDVDWLGNVNLLEEARKSGVKRFVYVSMAGLDEDGSQPVHKAKLQFEDSLQRSRLEWLIVRPCGIFTDVPAAMMRQALRGRILGVIGNGRARMTPIHPRDVADWIVEHADDHSLVEELGGPEDLTHDDMARLCFEVLGKRGMIFHVSSIVAEAWRLLTFPVHPRRNGWSLFLPWSADSDFLAPHVGRTKLRTYLEELAVSCESARSETTPSR